MYLNYIDIGGQLVIALPLRKALYLASNQRLQSIAVAKKRRIPVQPSLRENPNTQEM
jgi:hypothetical protein